MFYIFNIIANQFKLIRVDGIISLCLACFYFDIVNSDPELSDHFCTGGLGFTSAGDVVVMAVTARNRA